MRMGRSVQGINSGTNGIAREEQFMELWLAALLLIVCMGGAVVFTKQYCKSQKRYFLLLSVVAAILSLALIVYAGLTFTLLGGTR